jgi:hypothetical protein
LIGRGDAHAVGGHINHVSMSMENAVDQDRSGRLDAVVIGKWNQELGGF